MKKLLIILFVIVCAENLSAQIWSEWFNQKATQKKYLLQQIIALQVYSGYLSKGYSIAKSGLNTIKAIKNGDLLQHNNYFNSLITVNPKIKKYKKVAEIIAMQIGIVKQSNIAIKRINNTQQFSTSEKKYIKGVYNSLLTESIKDLDELSVLVSNGKLQMKDDERINAIDKIYYDMQDKQTFAMAFINKAAVLNTQRSDDEIDNIISQKLNGVK